MDESKIAELVAEMKKRLPPGTLDKLMPGYILDADRKVVKTDFITCALWFEDDDQRRVGQQIIGRFFVSTMFIAIDMNMSAIALGIEHVPVTFETMVFRSDQEGHPVSCLTRRYCTWSAAAKGHRRAVKYCTNTERILKQREEL